MCQRTKLTKRQINQKPKKQKQKHKQKKQTDARAEYWLFEEITQQFSINKTCFSKLMPSSEKKKKKQHLSLLIVLLSHLAFIEIVVISIFKL